MIRSSLSRGARFVQLSSSTRCCCNIAISLTTMLRRRPMQPRTAAEPHKLEMRHTKLLVSLVLAAPLCALAQNVEPCNYGFACLSPGGNPELVSPNQLARIIQGRTDEMEGQQVDVHRCDGLVGHAWLACNYVT